MKVCTKCGWQNEDDEAKCFQCFADLSAGKATASKSKAAKKEADAAVMVEPTATDESSEVWFDPDMRPIQHDTPDQILPGAVEVVEEEVVAPVIVEQEESGVKLPLWMLALIGCVMLALALVLGRAVA